MNKYKCEIFNQKLIIVQNVGNWLGKNIKLSYDKYNEYKQNYEKLWWFDDVMFIDEFRFLDTNEKYKIVLYNDEGKIICHKSGSFEEIVDYYINTIYTFSPKNKYFMSNINIIINAIDDDDDVKNKNCFDIFYKSHNNSPYNIMPANKEYFYVYNVTALNKKWTRYI